MNSGVRLRSAAVGFVGLVSVPIIWFLADLLFDSPGLPSVVEVAQSLVKLIAGVPFWLALGYTLLSTLLGLVLGILVTTAVAFTFGVTRAGDLLIRQPLYFVRALPSIAILPLLLASIGSSMLVGVLFVTLMVLLKSAVFIFRGARDSFQRAREQISVLGIGFLDQVRFVVAPSALRTSAMGARLGGSTAYGASIFAGIFAGLPGLGHQIIVAQVTANQSRAFALVVIAGLVGVGLFKLIDQIESRFSHSNVGAQ
jgi:ABC-type nitrate/sulfonate/bicarbonate transport system permease component